MHMNKEVVMVRLTDIIPNRFQPRLTFDEEALNELANSIKEHGIIQPLILRDLGSKYEIIAGERRYKAATIAGLTEVPAIIGSMDDQTSAEVALIENIQRKDLSAIEEAKSYQKVLELGNLTQETLAKRMGKGQSTIANKMRLLTLTNEVQVALMNNLISERHARCLLQIKDEDKQKEVLNKVIAERMNVRDTDNYIKNMLGLPNDNPTNSNISQVEVPNKPSLDFDIPKPVESNEPNINEPSSSEIEIPSFDNEKEEKPTSNSGEANLSVPIETKKQEENPNVYAQTNNVDFVNISSLNNDTEESQKLETPVVPTNDKQEDIDILERLRNEDDISGESEPKSMNNFELPNIDNNIQSNNLENSTDLSKIKLATAIKLTKDTIEVIKDAGYEVSLKETDNDKEYILTITVQK